MNNNEKGHKGFVKGKAPWNKGITYKNSDRARQNKAGTVKGTFIYNNGEIEIRLRLGQDIPEGFVKGRLITEERHNELSERYKKINKRRWNNG